MAKITYERGVKCKKCGNIITSFNKGNYYILCQNCGTHIMTYDTKNNEIKVTENAKIITVKVTHKLFQEIYEEVKI